MVVGKSKKQRLKAFFKKRKIKNIIIRKRKRKSLDSLYVNMAEVEEDRALPRGQGESCLEVPLEGSAWAMEDLGGQRLGG